MGVAVYGSDSEPAVATVLNNVATAVIAILTTDHPGAAKILLLQRCLRGAGQPVEIIKGQLNEQQTAINEKIRSSPGSGSDSWTSQPCTSS